jgi:hypothetical protein
VFKINVYIDPAWIKKSIASTGGEVTEGEYREWVLEYPELVMGHGHEYILEFGEWEPVVRQTMATVYKLKPETINMRVHIEKPGRYFITHLDRNRYRDWNDTSVTYNKDKQYQVENVYLTPLFDQELGQILTFNKTSVNWNAGDTFTFEHRNVPHSSANTGFHVNYILAITGEPLN